jgi:hypothetical protein
MDISKPRHQDLKINVYICRGANTLPFEMTRKGKFQAYVFKGTQR